MMLKQVDRSCANNFALSDRVRKQKLVTNPWNSRPLPAANFRHVFARVRIDKLDLMIMASPLHKVEFRSALIGGCVRPARRGELAQLVS